LHNLKVPNLFNCCNSVIRFTQPHKYLQKRTLQNIGTHLGALLFIPNSGAGSTSQVWRWTWMELVCKVLIYPPIKVQHSDTLFSSHERKIMKEDKLFECNDTHTTSIMMFSKFCDARDSLANHTLVCTMAFFTYPCCTHSVGEKGSNICFWRPICCTTENEMNIQFYTKQQSLDKYGLSWTWRTNHSLRTEYWWEGLNALTFSSAIL
jgi:hypothetical protein